MASWFSPSGPPLISSPNTSKYLSTDIVLLVSRADTKLVTGRAGIPRARKTVERCVFLYVYLYVHNKYLSDITGSGHGGKHPALPVFHRFRSIAKVVLKNPRAASPYPWANTVFE